LMWFENLSQSRKSRILRLGQSDKLVWLDRREEEHGMPGIKRTATVWLTCWRWTGVLRSLMGFF